MAQSGRGPDFIEALSRGLDVLRCFDQSQPSLSLSDVAQRTDLARPTVRRILLTLAELGYVRVHEGTFALTPRVLELGMAYVSSLGLWDIARPHMQDLVAQTHESSSMSQLDGSDIVYVARVAVPKLIALRVEIGTRFPAARASQGKVLLAWMDEEEVQRRLEIPSRSGLPHSPAVADFGEHLAQVREQGYALADEELAPGIRSVAVPVRDRPGNVAAAMNVTVHAAETSVQTLVDQHLPRLREAADRVGRDWALWQARPVVEDDGGAHPG